MTEREQKEKEIATIRKREIEILLSDADMQRLWIKAGEVGMTAGELLTSFIGDLVGGTYSNGSDERMYANRWLERCGFFYTAEKTFLRYLLEYGELDEMIFNYEEIVQCKETLAELEARTEKDEDDLEEIEYMREDIIYRQKSIDQIFNGFIKWRNGEHKGFVEEMNLILKWHKDMKGECD